MTIFLRARPTAGPSPPKPLHLAGFNSSLRQQPARHGEHGRENPINDAIGPSFHTASVELSRLMPPPRTTVHEATQPLLRAG
jgi:hypothetical protein